MEYGTEPDVPPPSIQESLQAECGALKVCLRHFETVYHDEEICPLCKIADEWLALTHDLA